MSWQFFIILYLILATVSKLLRRTLGKSMQDYNKLINAFFFVGVHYPLGLIVAQFLGYELNIGWFNFLTLVVASLVFPIIGLMSFKASRNVDASLFAIISIFKTVTTIIFAALILSEKLTTNQLVATLIIISAAFLVAVPSYTKSNKNTKIDIMIAILATFLIGLSAIYEVWILGRIGLGTYLIYGVGMQSLWMVIIAWPERKNLKKLFSKSNYKPVVIQALARSLQGFVYLAALTLSGSASIVGAYASFMPVLIVTSGIFLLKERKFLLFKLAGAIIGSIGLLMLSIG